MEKVSGCCQNPAIGAFTYEQAAKTGGSMRVFIDTMLPKPMTGQGWFRPLR
jgi:hypothetical protein